MDSASLWANVLLPLRPPPVTRMMRAMSIPLEVAAIVEPGQDSPAVEETDRRHRCRRHIEEQVIPRLQTQVVTDQGADDAPMGEDHDVFRPDRRQPLRRPVDPAEEVPQALAAGECKVRVPAVPAPDTLGIEVADLDKGQTLPIPEVDLPELGVGFGGQPRPGQRDSGRFHGPPEGTCETAQRSARRDRTGKPGGLP